MTNSHIPSIRELFEQALDLPREQQHEFVVRIAGADSVAAQEVLALLESAQCEQNDPRFTPPKPLQTLCQNILSEFDRQMNYPEQIGPYRILGVLGQGGMGVVYHAFDESMRRPVALKGLRNDLPPEAAERFQKEWVAVGALDSPHVVKGYTVHRDSDRDYLVMEYIEGHDLEKIVTRDGPLAPITAIHYIQQAARGLAAAHARGLIHRDIKPSNLIVTKSGLVKIMDFGIALEVRTDECSTTVALGTPDFGSPEQWHGQRQHITSASDLYSLGVTFYYLLTGRLPFPRARDLAEKILAHSMDTPDPLPPSLPGVSRQQRDFLQTVIDRMMHKDLSRRLASADELVQLLEEFPAHRSSLGMFLKVSGGILTLAGAMLVLFATLIELRPFFAPLLLLGAFLVIGGGLATITLLDRRRSIGIASLILGTLLAGATAAGLKLGRIPAVAETPLAAVAQRPDHHALFHQMAGSLAGLSTDEQRASRFLVLTHLDDDSDPSASHRLALARSILARCPGVTPIDDSTLIYRIDLGNDWWRGRPGWQELTSGYPFAIDFRVGADDPQIQHVYDSTGADLPFVLADWLFANREGKAELQMHYPLEDSEEFVKQLTAAYHSRPIDANRATAELFLPDPNDLVQRLQSSSLADREAIRRLLDGGELTSQEWTSIPQPGLDSLYQIVAAELKLGGLLDR